MNQLRKIAYAMVGAGDLAAERARGMVERARALPKEGPKDAEAVYEDLATRGENTYKKVVRSKRAERARTQTKLAARQFKGAMTSLRKAVGAEPERPRGTRAKAS